MTEQQINDEAIKHCSHIGFADHKILSESGKQRIIEWSQQCFIAGANWMQEQKQIKISSKSKCPDCGNECDVIHFCPKR